MGLSIRLPGDVEDRLKSLATRTGRTKSFYITEAITEQRLTDIRAGKPSKVALVACMRKLLTRA